MENLETAASENKNELVLEIQAEAYLRETRKWTKFFAILGFIFMGLGLLGSLGLFAASSMMSAYTPFPMGAMGVFYLLLIGLYFFPIYYLLQFSNKAKEALMSRRSQALTEAMGYIKSHYKFVGIMTIVMLALYPIIIIGAVIFRTSQGF
ncbi:hypothetical protein EO244_10920 [Ancylomarina salipaludis]|uniref:DUF5362 domain-containing protein n=1 Tax=Ancylomarina salipaludis TaxID=2501299 RepID=A0A4Q1JLF5_9BACT|nr:hypothetical protein [Ancylomarina salipaludis]RXQ92982.1 hypothetical protein EO244_10920 [Ancylomarina salipaludis]